MQAPPDEDLRASSQCASREAGSGASREAGSSASREAGSGAGLGEAEAGSGTVGLRVPGTLAYRHLAIRLVSTACRAALAHDLTVEDDAFTHEVVSAFGEAFNNVALHGYRGVPAGNVRVEVEWDDEKLVVVVMDMGRTFDPSSVSPPDLDAMQEGGMGVFIMRTCMDEVVYEPGPPNVLRLVKLRRPSAAPPASSPRGSRERRTAGDPSMEDTVERSTWRMKAVSDKDWGLGPRAEIEAGATDDRAAEGSRRR
jgi:serine/threonine-protein kinase RsbW